MILYKKVRIENKSLEFIMKIELIRKNVRTNHFDCDIHLDEKI